MRNSIRIKLFAAICGLILFYVVLSWLLNIFVLDKYYFYSKKNMIIESYKMINNLYKGDVEEISLELEKLEQTKGLRIVIQDRNYETKYDSLPKRKETKTKFQGRTSSDNQNWLGSLIESKGPELVRGKAFVENRKDSRLNTNFVILYSLLDNGDFIFLSTPVASIQESVEIANNFFLITGIITIISGGFLVFFITGRFTKPILELNKIARRMSTLDFSERYPVKNHDEIGQLGESINSLSEQLQNSILELKEANEKLKADIEKERKIDEMRKEFISNVYHELKTPIALIQGYAEGLKLNVNEDEENKNFYCDVIADEALKMNKLVKQLLELTQLEYGELPLEKVDFSVTKLVEQVVKKNALVFKEKGIDVVIESEEDIVVNADFDRTEQVLMNYMGNALNHVDDKRMIKVTVKKVGEKARVSVFNSGRHIPEECLDKIWASFYKVDKARTRAYGGTGLGLSIVRAIQEAHRNGYGVSNVEGGVEFWFELDCQNLQ